MESSWLPIKQNRHTASDSSSWELALLSKQLHFISSNFRDMRTEIISGLLVCTLLACAFAAGCSSTPGGTITPTPTRTVIPTIQSGSVTIDLVASGIAFDKNRISVTAGSQVTINFDNRDAGIQHNFALYADSQATSPIFKGKLITGPGMTTYYFTAPARAGTYYFQCDVHPSLMNGQFIVT